MNTVNVPESFIQVELLDDNHKPLDDDSSALESHESFCRTIETLTRIGIVKSKEVHQVVFLLHKQGKYYVAHYNELYKFDGEDVEASEYDIGIRNKVIDLISAWNLISVIEPEKIEKPKSDMHDIIVVPFSKRKLYKFVPKYNVGRK